MIKSLAVYKLANGEKIFNVEGVLSSSELAIIDRCSLSLSNYDKYKTLFQMVTDNYLDLTQYLDKEEKQTKHNAESIRRVGRTANRLTINYLSSAKLFIELSEKNIKVACGEDSNEFKEWKTATKKEFTENFSYRFLYHLRNFTQHYGFPIGSISSSFTNENKKDITLYFVRDSLISNNYNWQKDVMKDLKQAPEKFPVFKVINDYNGCMARLYQTGVLPTKSEKHTLRNLFR
ncbi:hypothetical protein [Sporosarcina ureilytica]|uniref:Uncharacterized protein n=1 Tax=Sporosarcina ureilytica TaxID=298596 RepID=A0A1D8JH30_9BACL|nr:hypothetical protein [Sporosarcina ureilytica]AOV08019.1 hypothetical protein BI350_11040 [Sporosarcina ureilytica]